MRMFLAAPAMLAIALAGCKTSSVTEPVKSAGSAVVSGAKAAGGAATSLVNVNLSNVLNDLALDLKIDKANIPINAQIPISIAANVCGVSINILSVSTGGSSGGCTAKTSSAELAQTVQQQLAAGGNVGGGAQTTTQPTSPTQPATTTETATEPPKDPQ